MTDGGDDDDMALGGSNNTDGGHLAMSLLCCRVLDLDLKPSIHAVSSGFTSSEERKKKQFRPCRLTEQMFSPLPSLP